LAEDWDLRDKGFLGRYSDADAESMWVVDGDLAWVFQPLTNKPAECSGTCIDAGEFFPAMSEAFQAIEDSWRLEKQRRPLERSSLLYWWAYLKVELANRYKIRWHTPPELNPTVVFD
jgi:hypothetical protein